jgi:hypothetical protein
MCLRCGILDITDESGTESVQGDITKSGDWKFIFITGEWEFIRKFCFALCFLYCICSQGAKSSSLAGAGQLARYIHHSELLELTRCIYLEINPSNMTDGLPNMSSLLFLEHKFWASSFYLGHDTRCSEIPPHSSSKYLILNIFVIEGNFLEPWYAGD